MSKIKEKIRDLSQKNSFIDYIWNTLWWIDVKRRLLMYSDVELNNRVLKERGKKLNLDNPQTLDEKACYLKLCNRDPLLTKCSDKHAVREYVESCGYENILKKEYACFDSADDIDFEKLHSPCYLKCNHASGMNFIYNKDKKQNLKHIKWRFNFFLKQNPYYLSREWNYKDIPPKIVCEEVIEMPNGDDIPELQFFCINGEPEFGIYNLGLADSDGYHTNPRRWAFWKDYSIVEEDVSWNYSKELPPIPKDYNELLECARKLSKPFPYVRVDLFYVNGKIYFNELTFYSGGGLTLSKVESIQKLGDLIDTSKYFLPEDASIKHTISELKNGKNNQ